MGIIQKQLLRRLLFVVQGENMTDFLEKLNGYVWGVPTMALILCTGLYYTWKSKCFQLTHFPAASRAFLEKLKHSHDDSDGVSAYQALCTALAATVGTGNIAGVAGAIALGGPGAIFWMWLCAVLDMILKCAEATLAVHYRRHGKDGQYYGGTMYMIEDGLGKSYRWLGCVYAFFGVVAAFGVGNATQINAVLDGLHSTADAFHIPVSRQSDLLIAGVIACMVGVLLCGGAKRIGRAAQALVPYASAGYILLGLGVLTVYRKNIPTAFAAILTGAFTPRAVTGGAIGSVFAVCRIGMSRGVFTNEAGMGTASIAHASANVSHPVQQGYMGIIEVFLDTVVICTVTALVILCSGVPIAYGTDAGAALTVSAFAKVYGNWALPVVTLFLACFALATVLGWSFYGAQCANYLFGERFQSAFIVLQVLTVFLAALLKTGTIWLLAELVNGLMAIPNLIALLGLSPAFFRLLRETPRKPERDK